MKFAYSKLFFIITFGFPFLGFQSHLEAKPDSINKTLTGLALKGYDVVSYFKFNQATEGSKKFQTRWKNAKWLFSSQINLELFLKNPNDYAPQFGGYCAYAVSQGNTANIDPKSFTIFKAKLYLNYNKKIQAKWEKNKENHIKQAEINWPQIVDLD